MAKSISLTSQSLAAVDLGRAQLGLAHSYSRAKVKFNVNRQDNMIIQVRLGPLPRKAPRFRSTFSVFAARNWPAAQQACAVGQGLLRARGAGEQVTTAAFY